MRQSEFKKKIDPNTGKFTRQHVFDSDAVITGGGRTDKFKSIIKRKKTPKPPPTPPTINTNKKAGDKIVKMLSSKPKPSPSKKPTNKKLTQQDINNKLLQVMYTTGGKIM